MRYQGPLPFPVETLGDLWDMPADALQAVEQAQGEADTADYERSTLASDLRESEEQIRHATRLLDVIQCAADNSADLPEFRERLAQAFRDSSFDGA